MERVKGSFFLQALRALFRLFGSEVPICLLLSLLILVGGCSNLYMDDNSSGGRGFSLTDLFSNLFRSSSLENFEADLNQPTLDSPNPGEPMEPPITEPYYPLQKDGQRLREINERLYFYTFGCLLSKHIFSDIIEAQFKMELKIEKVLHSDRVQDESFFEKMHQITGELFYPFRKPLSLYTYLDHLSQIENYGTYCSLPYKRVLRAIARDGIACVYGLNEIQAGKMVGFTSGVKRIALNLENENLGIVVLCSDVVIKEGDSVTCTGYIVDVPMGKAMLGRVVDGLGVPINGMGL
ncbi:ATP synthase subunit alpha, mitochondrial [Capsicum baccatum]|uniref:ATP synthase subunit alpha, mitochondrial n=1 Tax=Capsicum baccatum TaxID=33114 RepID=A0A2G2VM60_CAPBA|nr:ATP synthase subunit alpha, mitochondrial [Capsicum baccatum]